MGDARPPLVTELEWSGDLRFDAKSGGHSVVLDGDGKAGASPMQYAAFGLAGCMGADVVDILRKGRHPLKALRVILTGERADSPPRRFIRIALSFEIEGTVPSEAVERAIALSRRTYCSVWHSFRQDIEFTTRFDIRP